MLALTDRWETRGELNARCGGWPWRVEGRVLELAHAGYCDVQHVERGPHGLLYYRYRRGPRWAEAYSDG
jgi:hypothetical protein